jgi:hypothetical protein
MKRDKNVLFNTEAIKKDPSNNFIREWTKIKHMTIIITFSELRITLVRLFDYGINT